MTILKTLQKLRRLLALVDDVQLDQGRAILRMSKDVVVVSEGSTVTLNRGLAVSVSRFRHDNPIKAEDAFHSLAYPTSQGFLDDLTQFSLEQQQALENLLGNPQAYVPCPGDSCQLPCHTPAKEPVA